MKKKLVALGMASVMAASLAACGSSSGSSTAASTSAADDTAAQEQTAAPAADTQAAETTESTAEGSDLSASLTLWTYPVGSWGDSATVDSLISDFNAKYPGISVTVEYLDYTNGDDQVNTAIEGGQAPDLVLEGPERLVANWGAKGLMVDLSDLMAEDAASDLYDTIRSACTASDGKVYEYPLCMVAHCMAINRNMFEKADALQYLDEETHTWNSTEDFLKAVQAVYDSGQTDVAAVYCAGQGGDQGTRALVNNMYGGTFTNADHTAYTVSSDENNKALADLYAQDGINFDASLVGGDEINLFRQGVLAMSLCWNASQQNNTDNNDAGLTNDGDTILPMAFPTESGDAKLCGGIWGFGIFDNGDENKIAAAKTFIDFMCNDETEASKAVLAAGFFPVHQNMGNVYEGTDTAETMQMFTDYFMPKMGDYYQVTPGWAEARTAWWNMLQSIGTGSDIPTETANFDTTANAALAAATS